MNVANSAAHILHISGCFRLNLVLCLIIWPKFCSVSLHRHDYSAKMLAGKMNLFYLMSTYMLSLVLSSKVACNLHRASEEIPAHQFLLSASPLMYVLEQIFPKVLCEEFKLMTSQSISCWSRRQPWTYVAMIGEMLRCSKTGTNMQKYSISC